MTSSPANYQIAKGIVSFRPSSTAAKAWTATTAVTVGTYLLSGEKLYKVVGDGTTGSSAPTDTTAGITDGTAELDYVNWIDLGNAPKLEWTGEVTMKDHYSSREPIKTRDLRVVDTRQSSLNLTLDEITMENLQLATMGGAITGSVGSRSFEIFAEGQTVGQLKCVGTNDIGNREQWFFGNVSFQPGKAISIIGDDFTALEMQADVNKDALGKYGTITELA